VADDNRTVREPAPGHGPVKTNLVQRRERGRGKGNSRSSFEADRKIDARSQTGTAPDGNTDMREPANKSLLTDVSGLRSYRCTIININALSAAVESTGCGASELDQGHKRMRAEYFASYPDSA
jgi:hypothetical protein